MMTFMRPMGDSKKQLHVPYGLIVSALLTFFASTAVQADYLAALDAYLRGDGTSALTELKASAEKKDPVGLLFAARTLRDIHLVRKTTLALAPRYQIEAIQILGRAAENENGEVQFQLYELAAMHQMPEARTFLRRGAEKGNSEAQYRLAVDQRTAFEEAVALIRSAAEKNFGPAMFRWAALLENASNLHGKFIARDDAGAAKLYMRIAAGNYRELSPGDLGSAKSRLATMFYEGRGVPKDLRLAYQFALEAAALENLQGAKVVADLYERGDLSTPTPAVVQAWRKKAYRATP